eukprot:TRINITY_DN28166_c0_g1_i9.p4 TRINITY_DN28166_c0_g1~~TRINITY_DN28166_c0_g1_i9.p4  ORF type:complete len:211 (-),score=16.99 TRINITY_DN28166_c0_g1_i9:2692-3237(-)
MDLKKNRVQVFLEVLIGWSFVISGAFVGILQGLYIGLQEIIESYVHQVASLNQQDTHDEFNIESGPLSTMVLFVILQIGILSSQRQQLIYGPFQVDQTQCVDVDSAFGNLAEEILQQKEDDVEQVCTPRAEEQQSSSNIFQQQQSQDDSSGDVVRMLEDVWLGSPENKNKRSLRKFHSSRT